MSLSKGSQNSYLGFDRRLTVGSPSLDYRSKLLRLVSILTILLTIGVGNAWGTDETSTFSSQYLAVGDGEPEWTGTSGSGFEDDRGVQYSATNGTTKTFTSGDFHGKTIKSVSAVVSRNKTGYPVSISVTVNNSTLGDGDTSGDQPSKETITTSDDDGIACEDGDIVVTISTGGPSSSAKSLYVKSISVTYETAPSVAQTVRFYKTDGTYTDLTEASAGAGVTPPTMQATCGDWEFQGWSTSQSTSTTSKTVLSTITLTTGKYYPSSATTLYPVYTKDGVEESYVEDEITHSINGKSNTNTTYTSFSNKSFTSDAVYAGQSNNGNNGTIKGVVQLRNSDPAGIVTTSSGGVLRKVTIDWNTNTASGRYVTIYGKKSAYTGGSDLYDDATRGTSLGTIKYGTSTELSISADSTFIGIKANNALYINKITIKWAVEEDVTYYYSYPSCCTELGSINGSILGRNH